MPWFKIDDSLWGHPKWLASSPAARALWVTAGSWCMAQVQDGKVPSIVLPMLGGKAKDAAELVTVGLWEKADDGWLFHDWHDYQPSREQIEADRHAARERQKRARDRAKSQRESRRDDAVTNAVVTPLVTVPPTRPDPTRPEVPDGTSKSGRRRAPEIRLPDSWQPTDGHRAYAGEHRLDVDAEAFKFRNHAQANDRRQRQWDAAFSTWLARAREYAPKQPREDRFIDQVPEAWR